jgi:hypothetical protein
LCCVALSCLVFSYILFSYLVTESAFPFQMPSFLSFLSICCVVWPYLVLICCVVWPYLVLSFLIFCFLILWLSRRFPFRCLLFVFCKQERLCPSVFTAAVPISFIANHIYLSNKLIVCFYHPSECTDTSEDGPTNSIFTVLLATKSEKRASVTAKKKIGHGTIYSPVFCLFTCLSLSFLSRTPPSNTHTRFSNLPLQAKRASSSFARHGLPFVTLMLGGCYVLSEAWLLHVVCN